MKSQPSRVLTWVTSPTQVSFGREAVKFPASRFGGAGCVDLALETRVVAIRCEPVAGRLGQDRIGPEHSAKP